MASLYQEGKIWRASIYVGGRRETKSFRTQREAKSWAAEREAALREAQNKPAPELYTVEDAFNRYVRDVSPKKASADKERLRLSAFIRDFPKLAAIPLADFKTPHLVEWRDARLKKVKPSSVVRDVNLIRNVFLTARDEWHWIEHNPFTGLKIPQEGPPRDRRVDPWKEVRPVVRTLDYVTGREPVTLSQEVALAWLVALRSGMRVNEILQLGKDTIDLDKRVARVKHKMQYATGKPREIPLTRHVVRLLRPVAHRQHFFTVDSASLDTLFRKAKARVGITGMQFRDSRAEALTRLAKRVDVLKLSKISGHKDLEMLSRVYYRETAEQIAATL
ncbi:phage integrase family protein [Burkholderia pseudomallei]|uniref:tyrosine-type recombinase/integrase n=1 Tax=Burkholderia pseudomallei TaxID=28450 RepID=UPI0003755E86|nr:tyrosine-type recombinase/integrase [Burkholderia pseudomallei]AIV79460.1 phage integrase family protein [Burkholderia pseudomallei]KGD06089.1 phage integrase family protein [Burkholderia pseudomallei]KGV06518.1 phage integrase family protein [Burkholderia pseudomallei MSHR4503]KGV49398.1 phage integrase family protein [Burkholderia pseudomallei BDU 2]MBD2919409.1 tyrosine-type recombinase/integrase [Burkholderia pseudomallei]